MSGKHHAINASYSFNNFLSLLFWHKNMVFLFLKPVIIIYNNNQSISQFFSLLKKPDMAGVYRIKTATHRYNYFFILMLHDTSTLLMLSRTNFPYVKPFSVYNTACFAKI